LYSVKVRPEMDMSLIEVEFRAAGTINTVVKSIRLELAK